MAQQYDVTSVGVNPAADRARRMRMYFLAMTLRVLCIVSLFWVRGYWIILVGLGAVLLPYFAVLIANAVSHVPGTKPSAPAPLQLTDGVDARTSTNAGDAIPIIVIDDPAPSSSREQGSDA